MMENEVSGRCGEGWGDYRHDQLPGHGEVLLKQDVKPGWEI